MRHIVHAYNCIERMIQAAEEYDPVIFAEENQSFYVRIPLAFITNTPYSDDEQLYYDCRTFCLLAMEYESMHDELIAEARYCFSRMKNPRTSS